MLKNLKCKIRKEKYCSLTKWSVQFINITTAARILVLKITLNRSNQEEIATLKGTCAVSLKQNPTPSIGLEQKELHQLQAVDLLQIIHQEQVKF